MATQANSNAKMGRRLSERISQYVLYGLTSFSAILFVMFYLVGFNTPYWKNESMNAPLLTDMLLGLMIGICVLTVLLAILAKVHSVRVNRGSARVVNGIPARKISISISLFTLLVLIIGFLLTSTDPMTVNGETYTNWWGLKVSGMLITTASVLLLSAIGAALFGATRYNRKEKKKKG